MAINEASPIEIEANQNYDTSLTVHENIIRTSKTLRMPEDTVRSFFGARRLGATSYGEMQEYFRKKLTQEKFPEFIQRKEDTEFYNGTIRSNHNPHINTTEDTKLNLKEIAQIEQTREEMLEVALKHLNPEERMIIEGKFLRGMSRPELGNMISKTPSMTDKITKRALTKMRNYLEEIGCTTLPSYN